MYQLLNYFHFQTHPFVLFLGHWNWDRKHFFTSYSLLKSDHKGCQRERVGWGGRKRSVLLPPHKWVKCTFKSNEGFPGGLAVKNPPVNAGDMGSVLGLGRSHLPRGNWAPTSQPLSLCTRAKEMHLLKLVCPNAHARQPEKPLLTTTKENPGAAMKTQSSQR